MMDDNMILVTEDLYQKKKETLEYMMGILRSYSAEAGDDLPVIELEVLSMTYTLRQNK